jgi:hypothetical protein
MKRLLVFEFLKSKRRLNDPGTKQLEGLSLGMLMYNSSPGLIVDGLNVTTLLVRGPLIVVILLLLKPGISSLSVVFMFVYDM